MKRELVLLLAILFMIAGFSQTASACHFNTVTIDANCFFFTIEGNGWINYHLDIRAFATYSLILTPATGDPVPVQGEFDIEFDPNNGNFYKKVEIDWPIQLCDNYTLDGSISLYTDRVNNNDIYWHTYDFTPKSITDCLCETVGTGTPGYWKNHPEAWPEEGIEVGGVYYTYDTASPIMNSGGKGDKTLTMFNALIAAKLNVDLGTDPTCISKTITDANTWMVVNNVYSKVKANSNAWKEGEPLSLKLDQYNNGDLCAPSRDSLEGSEKIATGKCKTCRPASKLAVQEPVSFTVAQNYPNPFNPTTTIEYSLPHESYVTLKIYDSIGKEVATLVDRHSSAGLHAVQWRADNVASGIYFYTERAGEFTETREMLLVR